MKYGLSQKTIDQITGKLASSGKVEKAVLFGSRAKGTHRPGSDIDLALFGNSINHHDILQLSIELDALDLPYKIDLVNYSTVTDEAVKEHISRVGVDFYKR